MKKIIKTAVSVELTPQEMALVIAYQNEHECSRMAAIRNLIRGAKEEQRLGKEIQLLGARVDSLSLRFDGLVEAMHQMVAATKDIRLGVAFAKISIEELNKDDSVAMQAIQQRYTALKNR